MTPFPWKDAMRFGLGVLRLPPRDFWSMTPRELAAAWGAIVGDRGGPLGRDDLTTMMESYPDGR